MHQPPFVRLLPATSVLCLFGGLAQAQQFQYQVGLIPGTPRWSEGVAAADVENDGDFDLFFADGDGYDTPGTKRQNVLVVNRLEQQPGLFNDVSVARLGVSISHGKMVITGDIQGDGFVDAVFCNAFYTDPPFLFVNQSANPGFFTKENAQRGLTSNLSSASGQFGDLDNDGDLDLVLNDTGPAWLGAPGGRPRLYINDGLGFFTEDAVKMNAALKVGHMGVQLVDIDNDLDLDFFGPNRNFSGGKPHYLMLNDGTGAFGDASNLLPNTGGNVYEADAADLDGDADIDFFFLSLAGFQDGWVRNDLNPSGTLSFAASAPFGAHDDNEVSFLDYDNDGDLDVILGCLSGPREKLYRNDGNMVFVEVPNAFNAPQDATLDAAVVDLNNDGAYDVVTSQGEGQSAQWVNKVHANVGAPDTRAPVIVREEALNQPSSNGPWVVRTVVGDQVLDDGHNWVRGSGEYVVNTSAQTAGIAISGFSFPPLSVPAGTTVTWTNNSGVAHDVTSTTDGYGFASGPFSPGGSFSYSFVRPGTYTYACTLHPGMNGVLTVTGSSSPAKVTYSMGSTYRTAMVDTQGGLGVELVYETRFVDWAGNLTVTESKRVPLGSPCGFAAYGQGASPANDLVLVGSGSGAVGGVATLTTSNVSGSFSVLALSLGSGFLPLFGGTGLLDAGLLVTTVAVPAAGGVSAANLPIPNDAGLAGFGVYFQSFALDGTKPEGVALSNGVALTICP